jgi:hypothetical protein
MHERNILHMTNARVRFDPCGVGAVDGSDVGKCDIVHIFRDGSGIAEGAYDHGTRLVACYVGDVNVGAIAFDRDAVLDNFDSATRTWIFRRGLTSPQVTTQFLITISLEFQLSKPSVFTVLHWEFEVAFMSRFVIVMFCEYATKVCLQIRQQASLLSCHGLTRTAAVST